MNIVSKSHLSLLEKHSHPPYSSIAHDAKLESMYQEARQSIQSVKKYIYHHFDQISLDWYKHSLSHPKQVDFQFWFIQSHQNQLSLNALKDRIHDITSYLNQHDYKDTNEYLFTLTSNEKLLFDFFERILESYKGDLEDIFSQLFRIDQELVEIARRLPIESSLKAYLEQVKHILVYGNMKLKAFKDPSLLESEIDIQKYVNFLFQHGKHKKGLEVLEDFKRVKKQILL